MAPKFHLPFSVAQESSLLAKDKEGNHTSVEFQPGRQAWRLFKELFPRLVFSLIIIAFYAVVLILSERNINISHTSKQWFNAATTILSLALGLNFLEAFKDMAKVLRWRVLANRRSTVREADLILGGESLMKLGSLIWESKKPVIILLCTIWILLNLLAQAAVAILSLNYTMDKGDDSSGTYNQTGTIQAAKLDCYMQQGGCPIAAGAQMSTAHIYGELVRDQECCEYAVASEIKDAPQECPYFCRKDQHEYAYRFKEYSPLDTTEAYPYLTNRYITASASQCYGYDIDFPPSETDSRDGGEIVQYFGFHNATARGNQLPFLFSSLSENQTSYVYNGSTIPQIDNEVTCGDRCVRMYVLRVGYVGEKSQIYSCDITVNGVQNAEQDWQQISTNISRLAAASIALTGRSRISTTRETTQVWQQSQLYSFDSYWETQRPDAAAVGASMAEYALGSLATMIESNPKTSRPGTLPVLGYRLTVDWLYVEILFVCIAVIHAILVAATLCVSWPIFVGDDSDLCIARLLHPTIDRLQGHGSMLSEKELAGEIQRRGVDDGKVVYGLRRGGATSAPTLALAGDVEVRKKLKGHQFPKGSYA